MRPNLSRERSRRLGAASTHLRPVRVSLKSQSFEPKRLQLTGGVGGGGPVVEARDRRARRNTADPR
eukprot:6266184-Pyramimonas_sp.AAC.1